MTVTLPQLLRSKSDVFENCRKQVHVGGSYRMTAEIILKSGERRFFRTKSIDKNSAVREVLTFIAAIEDAKGESVMWRFKGEDTYHMSTNYTTTPSFLNRAKDAFLSYFFEA
ncbi:DUF6018 family natural product bioysynthesis protein [Mesobacillus zeae]|uniref:DUF6018 family natural product bioysynthesis protein n=1 Tax=Mesobacillus zeae TaxID=1917180 RepID=UPI003008C46B